MNLGLKVEHECNRLLAPKGALGHGDTTENRTNSLIFLYKLELIDEFTFIKVSKAIDLTDFENPEENLASTILEDAKVKTAMKVKVSLPDHEVLRKNAEREYNFLLTHARILGQADSAFIRAIYLNILFRLQLISYASFSRGMDVLKYMDFSFKKQSS